MNSYFGIIPVYPPLFSTHVKVQQKDIIKVCVDNSISTPCVNLILCIDNWFSLPIVDALLLKI